MKKVNQEAVKLLGMILLLVVFILFAMTFWSAYTHDGEVVVYVNNYGEADMELSILCMMGFFALWALFYTARDFYKICQEEKNGSI